MAKEQKIQAIRQAEETAREMIASANIRYGMSTNQTQIDCNLGREVLDGELDILRSINNKLGRFSTILTSSPDTEDTTVVVVKENTAPKDDDDIAATSTTSVAGEGKS